MRAGVFLLKLQAYRVVIVVKAYHHILVDASNHFAPEPSVVFPTVYGVGGWIRTSGPRRVASLAGKWFQPLTHTDIKKMPKGRKTNRSDLDVKGPFGESFVSNIFNILER